jgi:putative nucleotidyltransferase with HDIG domain
LIHKLELLREKNKIIGTFIEPCRNAIFALDRVIFICYLYPIFDVFHSAACPFPDDQVENLGGYIVAQLKIGVSIKRDIFNKSGALVVPANTKLKGDDISKLINHRINLAEIEYSGEQVREIPANSVSMMLDDATDQVKKAFDSIRYGHRIPLTDMKRSLIPVIRQAAEPGNLFQLLNMLRSKDDHTYKHNVGVGVLATLIGRWLKLDETELSVLALAGTLHDIGKMKVSNDIIHKPGKLTFDEYELMKKHTIWGYEMLKKTAGSSHRLAIVALQHHEREDGSGYPFGLSNDKIDPFSKIVSIADVFHAMTSQRSYHAASSFFTVIKQMNSDVFGKLNAKIFFMFMKKMMESMVGSEAVLTDGRKVKIVLANPYDPINPLVMYDDQFMDLSKDRTLQLQEILG